MSGLIKKNPEIIAAIAPLFSSKEKIINPIYRLFRQMRHVDERQGMRDEGEYMAGTFFQFWGGNCSSTLPFIISWIGLSKSKYIFKINALSSRMYRLSYIGHISCTKIRKNKTSLGKFDVNNERRCCFHHRGSNSIFKNFKTYFI